MTAVDRDALVRYFGSLSGSVIAITDVQAVIENWPETDHFAEVGKKVAASTIEDVWQDFFERIVEWSEFLDEHTDAENDGQLRELLWDLIARVLLVKSP